MATKKEKQPLPDVTHELAGLDRHVTARTTRKMNEPCALMLRQSNRAAAPSALRTQELTILRPEAARRGYDVVRVYCDDGYSGEPDPLDRPAVKECLTEAEQVVAARVARTRARAQHHTSAEKLMREALHRYVAEEERKEAQGRP
jgi:DNA invertase Pin-like site-specific DNA recombinase